MPKAVDIYVLDKKIGSGQFGDVFKGYSKIDGTDVAIKTIRRDKIKGKFTQLLDNQIQVLKSCKNNNIIRLIDIKKTVHNIYLILEYCNEGDLNAYLKSKKKIPQQEAVEYIVQMLHAFQTLVKNKMMHRDFKLANVLKNNGCIKIADFGFSKLLGSEDQQVQTILGSPLNMAPEVLDRQAYNSKADIWSMGVAIYQLIYGRVPFTAGNIIDLLKKIKKQPLQFPHKANPAVEDVLRRMLVVDPQKRIDWVDLFKHPVTRLLEERIESHLQKSMLCEKDQLPINMSKLYIKANKVVENVNDICLKKDFNNYIKTMINSKEKNSFIGQVIKRNTERKDKENINFLSSVPSKTQKQLKIQDQDKKMEQLRKTEEIKQITFKKNCKNILALRNIYAFMGLVAEDLIDLNLNVYAECLAFLIVKNVIRKISNIKFNLQKRKLNCVENWLQWQNSQEYKQIYLFLSSQEEVYNKFYENLSIKILEAKTLQKFETNLMISGQFTFQDTNKRILEGILGQYLKRVYKEQKFIHYENSIHLLKLFDVSQIDELKKQFDFGQYYEWYQQAEENQVRNKCKNKMEEYINAH